MITKLALFMIFLAGIFLLAGTISAQTYHVAANDNTENQRATPADTAEKVDSIYDDLVIGDSDESHEKTTRNHA